MKPMIVQIERRQHRHHSRQQGVVSEVGPGRPDGGVWYLDYGHGGANLETGLAVCHMVKNCIYNV